VGNYPNAIAYLERALTYPSNLGEGKLQGVQDNNIHYYLGCAYEGLNDRAAAQQQFEKASVGLSEPSSPIFYNDQPPDMIFYQGKALEKLGQQVEADAIFNRLIDYGQNHFGDHITVDYFAVSLPDFLVFEEDLDKRNQIHCHHMMALGYLGLKKFVEAREQIDTILSLNAYQIGATVQKTSLRP